MRPMAVLLTPIGTKRLLTAFIGLILAFIALTFVTFNYMNSSTEYHISRTIVDNNYWSKTLDVFDRSSNRVPRVQSYCNPFTTIEFNEELFNISAVISHLSLCQVSVLIRHGDRGPLRPVRNMSTINCDPFVAFKSTHYHNLFKSFVVQTKDKIKHLSKVYAKSPKWWCELGGLTKYGSVQHLTLGSLMAQTYAHQLGLKSNQMKVYSTPYSRTYQSAMAFVYGFLRPKSVVDFNTFPQITTTFGTYFCSTTEYCLKKCKKLDFLHKALNDNKKQILASHPAVIKLLSNLKSIIAHNINESYLFESPIALFDGLMAYMCHNSALPCNENKCITIEDVKELISYIEYHGKQLAVSEVFKHLNWLKIYGFLNNLIQNINQKRDKHKFILYSGHDITIVALNSALDFFDGNLPPYASRVIFETYRHQLTDDLYLRIIFNGKDVTRFTEICKLNPSKCQTLSTQSKIHLINFNDFITFILFKFKSFTQTSVYQNACDV